MRELIAERFKKLQDSICRDLETADGGGQFREDLWDRPGGGGGRARVIQGDRIEKGGVNFSAVYGAMPEKIIKALGVEAGDFFATGVSIVLHPRNPWVPIIHMNVRYFEMESGVWWFGGGIDLTPHYVIPEDARWFHEQLKATCDAFDPAYYPQFKPWADRYFYLKHRRETRGVGGIFFDQLSGPDQQPYFKFVLILGESFTPIYTHFLNRYAHKPFTKRERSWQLLRRGRYVEFNLVWDKGTKFGLDTDGRTESILMSLPPTANWVYDYQPEPGSPEENTLQWLGKKSVDWLVTGQNTHYDS